MKDITDRFKADSLRGINRSDDVYYKPFIGPRPFNQSKEDQERFFGRDAETEEIVALIASHKLVLVYAKSGAGKTSIFHAQVIPTLREYGYEVLPVARVRISSDIVYEKSSSEIKNVYIFNTLTSLDSKIDPKLLKNKSLSEYLKERFDHLHDEAKTEIQHTLIFDQLEEIFNIFPNDYKTQRIDFFKQVAQALKDIDSLQIVFIIREDYLAELDPYRDLLPEKLKPRFRLERLNEVSALKAVAGPLSKVPKDFMEKEVGNVEEDIKKLIKELMTIKVEDSQGRTHLREGQFIEPIQLQVVFRRWWKNKTNPDNKMYKESTTDVIFVDKALEDFYEEAINGCVKAGISEIEIRKWCQDKLITSSDTRSMVHRGTYETEGLKNDIIDILDKNYFVRAEYRAGAKWYELAHDRLINPIKSSNQRWRREQELKKRSIIKKVAIPSIITAVIMGIAISMYFAPIEYDINSFEDIKLSETPYILAVNSGTGVVYASNAPDTNITVIDGESDKVTKYIQVKYKPFDIEIDPKRDTLYVTHPESDKISAIDLKKDQNNFKYLDSKGRPSFMGLDSNNSLLYVTNFAGNTVSVINLTTNNVQDTVNVGRNPRGIDIDSGKAYVTNSRDNTVSVIDLTTNNVQDTVNVGRNPTDIEIDSGKAYVTNWIDNTVSVINLTTNKVQHTVNVGKNPTDIEINPSCSKVFVAHSGDTIVSVIDPQLDIVVGTLKVGEGKRPIALGINSVQNILYVSRHNDNFIRAIDMKDHPSTEVLSNIPLGTHPSGITIATSQDNKTKTVYVTNKGSNSVSIIDGTTNMVKKVLPVGQEPSDIDINSNTKKLYVSNSLSNTISVIDIGKEEVEYTIDSIGKNPIKLAVDVNKDLIYVINKGSNNVSLINGTTREVIGDIKVKTNPTDIVVDSNNDLVYVTNSDNSSSSVSVINGTTREVIGHIPMNPNNIKSVGDKPTDILVDSKYKLAYIFTENGKIVKLETQKITDKNSQFNYNITDYVTIVADNSGKLPGLDLNSEIALNSEYDEIYITSMENNVMYILHTK
jgi:YVTN family beta-propeller protein